MTFDYCILSENLCQLYPSKHLLQDQSHFFIRSHDRHAVPTVSHPYARIPPPPSSPQIVDFTQPYYDTGLRILVNRLLGDSNVDTSRFWQFLKPFNMWLWVLIGVMCVSFAVTMFMFERRKNEIDFVYESSASNAGVVRHHQVLLKYRTRHHLIKEIGGSLSTHVCMYVCVCVREMPSIYCWGYVWRKPAYVAAVDLYERVGYS